MKYVSVSSRTGNAVLTIRLKGTQLSVANPSSPCAPPDFETFRKSSRPFEHNKSKYVLQVFEFVYFTMVCL